MSTTTLVEIGTASLEFYARAFIALHKLRPSEETLAGLLICHDALSEASYQSKGVQNRQQFEDQIDFNARLAYSNPTTIPGIGRTVPWFVEQMTGLIQDGLTIAWEEGAKAAGLDREEISDDEWQACGELQDAQISYLEPFAEWLVKARNQGISTAEVAARAALWKPMWDVAMTKAKLMAMGNKKLEWKLGATEQHCKDCARYNGRVYRASAWLKAGVEPRSHRLECGGWRCDCRLEPTDKKATPGKPPRPTGNVGEAEVEEYGTASSGNHGHAGVKGKVAEIGTTTSGNWAHAGVKNPSWGKGGSAGGGGHAAHGIAGDMEARIKAVKKIRTVRALRAEMKKEASGIAKVATPAPAPSSAMFMLPGENTQMAAKRILAERIALGGLPYQPDEQHIRQALAASLISAGWHVGEKVTPEQLARLNEGLKVLSEEIDGQPVMTHRSYNSVERILDEGRWKTQFEVKTSGGTLDKALRARAEESGLGTPHDVDPKERSVYGFVMPKTIAAGASSCYGDINIELKDSVKERTSLTVGDSLYMMENGSLVGTPLLHPGPEGLDGRAGDLANMAKNPSLKTEARNKFDYFEVQIQGGLRVEDIARVRIPAKHLTKYTEPDVRARAEALIKKLDALGIPHSTWQEDSAGSDRPLYEADSAKYPWVFARSGHVTLLLEEIKSGAMGILYDLTTGKATSQARPLEQHWRFIEDWDILEPAVRLQDLAEYGTSAASGESGGIGEVGTATSGNYGHKGVKGKVGGSAPGGGHARLDPKGDSASRKRTVLGWKAISAASRLKPAAAPSDATPVPVPLPFPVGDPGKVEGHVLSPEDVPDYEVFTTFSSYEVDGHADGYLHQILKGQGFDGPAQLVDSLEPFQNAGEITLHRGVQRPEQAEQFRTGELYAGHGIYGNGTYTGMNIQVADDYSGSGEAGKIHMTLRADAKIIDHREAEDRASTKMHAGYAEAKQNHEDAIAKLDKDFKAKKENGPGTQEDIDKYLDDNKVLAKQYRKEMLAVSLYEDPGRWAAMEGYDAMVVQSQNYYVILNRTAVRVLKKGSALTRRRRDES